MVRRDATDASLADPKRPNGNNVSVQNAAAICVDGPNI